MLPVGLFGFFNKKKKWGLVCWLMWNWILMMKREIWMQLWESLILNTNSDLAFRFHYSTPNLRIQIKLEPRSKPNGSHDTERVVQKSIYWRQWCLNDSQFYIIETFACKIFHFFVVNVIEKRIDSKVPSKGIFCSRSYFLWTFNQILLNYCSQFEGFGNLCNFQSVSGQNQSKHQEFSFLPFLNVSIVQGLTNFWSCCLWVILLLESRQLYVFLRLFRINTNLQKFRILLLQCHQVRYRYHHLCKFPLPAQFSKSDVVYKKNTRSRTQPPATRNVVFGENFFTVSNMQLNIFSSCTEMAKLVFTLILSLVGSCYDWTINNWDPITSAENECSINFIFLLVSIRWKLLFFKYDFWIVCLFPENLGKNFSIHWSSGNFRRNICEMEIKTVPLFFVAGRNKWHLS